MLAKTLILFTLGLILVSLFSAAAMLFGKPRDDAQRKRVAQALTVRIGLSLLLFATLVAGFALGWIPGRG